MQEWSRVRAVSNPALESPSVHVMTVAEAKAAIHVDTSDDDALIQTYIDGALAMLEGPQGIGISILQRQWSLTLDKFPTAIELPVGPVLWVDSIAYVDTDGASQTLATTEYTVDLMSDPARIVPAYDKTWPTVRSHINVITVTFTAGYAAGEAIPRDLLTAMQQVIGHWYENREAVVIGRTIAEVPMSARETFERYRVGRFG